MTNMLSPSLFPAIQGKSNQPCNLHGEFAENHHKQIQKGLLFEAIVTMKIDFTPF